MQGYIILLRVRMYTLGIQFILTKMIKLTSHRLRTISGTLWNFNTRHERNFEKFMRINRTSSTHIKITHMSHLEQTKEDMDI